MYGAGTTTPVRKVLIVHQHFKTPLGGGAIRSYYLAKALVARGIRTVAITAHNDDAQKVANVEGVEVSYLPIPYDNRFGFYRRLLSFYNFARAAVAAAANHSDADLVYAISTPLTTGIAARAIQSRFKIPYIFEVGDLWPDAPIGMGIIRNALLKSLLFRLEHAIYADASAIVALSNSIRDHIDQKLPGKVVHVVPNMADTEFFRPTKKDSALEEKFGSTGKFVVSYIGALGVANGLRHFLQCAAASQEEGLPIHFLMCGAGAMERELKAYAQELELANLSFLPFQNRNGVRDVMNVTDANFISYLPVQILETGSPNKYFDGLAAGKLTVVNFGGWIRSEIENERCGIFANPTDGRDFVRKIRPFLQRDLLDIFGKNARALAERKYSRADLSSQYADLLMDFL